MKALQLTEQIRAALAEVRAVQGTFVMGRDSMTILEVAKLRLAETVIAEIERQRRAQLPSRGDRGVVFVKLQPVRRRRA